MSNWRNWGKNRFERSLTGFDFLKKVKMSSVFGMVSWTTTAAGVLLLPSRWNAWRMVQSK